ncbi:MAG: alpha/beta hydrolase, partial [Sphingopyxis sp.]
MSMDRRALLSAAAGAVAAGGWASRAAGQTAPPVNARPLPAGLPDPVETIDLWPRGAPGAP